MLFGGVGGSCGRIPPGVRPSGVCSLAEGMGIPNLVIGALACGPSRLPVVGVGGWTGTKRRGGGGEGTSSRLTRGRGVGRGIPGHDCTSLVTLVVAIQGGWVLWALEAYSSMLRV